MNLRFGCLAILVALIAVPRGHGAVLTLVSPGSTWRYFDGGTAATNWYEPDFDDSSWPAGPTPLGWGLGDEVTPIAQAVSPKPVTVYLRHTFVVTNSVPSSQTLRLQRDDGVVVYVNGFEVTRVNLPASNVDSNTLASSEILGAEATRWVQRGSYYAAQGTNVIAVELHQARADDADARFDLELIAGLPLSAPTVRLLAPSNGAVLPLEPVTLAAKASDLDGHVLYVDYWATSQRFDGEELLARVSEPFTGAWLPPRPGRYRVWARAVDDSGRSLRTETVSIQVGEAGLPRLLRGPYLQSGSSTSVVVRWRTDWFTDSRVAAGLRPDALNIVFLDSAPKTEHAVQLNGLRPNTKYYYAITSSSNAFAGGVNYHFVTAPLTAKPTRVWVIGDAGTRNLFQFAVRNAYSAFSRRDGTERPTDLWLMLGDNAYECGTDEEYQGAVFSMYSDLLRRSVVWPTLGNHEACFIRPDGQVAYHDMFTLPTRGEAGGVPSGTENYYSFDYGNVHFVCLDANLSNRRTGGPMLTWLEQDLIATDKEWIIAFWHQPPYSFGTHDSDGETDMIEMRENAVPLLERYGVDLVLSGHSHVYERSFLLNGHYSCSSNLTREMIVDGRSGRAAESTPYTKPAGGLGANRGAVYIVCGNSGQGGVLNFRQHPAMHTHLGGFGSVVLDIEDRWLEAKFLTSEGDVADSFTMLKGSPTDDVRPELQLTRAGEVAHVAWPTSLARHQLEATESLSPDARWQDVAVPPAVVARSNIVTMPMEATNQIFRLRRVFPQ